MKSFIQAAAVLAASAALAACGGNAPAGNNAAAPANAPAKPANSAAADNAAAPASEAEGAARPATIGPNGRRPIVTVTNRSTTPITNFYIGPTSSDEWGDDLFTAGDPLAAGASMEIEFDRDEDVCVWDIKVIVRGGTEHELRNINLCTTHEVVYAE